MKKGLLLVAASCFLTMSLSGCNNNGGKSVDKTKTQLGVRYYDAGFGSRWLDDLINDFEEKYKDVSFEAGKKGVQVIPHANANGDLLPNIKSKGDDQVFFSEDYYFDYYAGQDSGTPCADLTDIMSKKLNESIGNDVNGNPIPAVSNENVSVMEKIREVDKASYLIDKTNSDGQDIGKRLFGLPYIDCYRGTINYNEDLFNQKELFFNSDNELCASLDDDLGTGPDGISGTADDGLPRTYEEFYELCDTLATEGIMPLTWAGNWTGYLNDMMGSLRAQSAGSVQLKSYYTGEGTLYDYIDDSAFMTPTNKSDKHFSFTNVNDVTGSEKTFDTTSFSRTYQTISEYAPVEFMYKIIRNHTDFSGGKKYYYGDKNFLGTYTHINAQEEFIWGKVGTGNKDTAMLVDGSWWWNEAENALRTLENQLQTPRNTKHLKYMAMPKANMEVFNRTKGENVVFADYDTALCVKNNLTGAKKTLAELFVQFACTNEQLAKWNVSVNTPRSLMYTLTDEQYNSLSPYGQCIYDIHNQTENTTDASKNYSTYVVVQNKTSDAFYRDNVSVFDPSSVFASSTQTNKFVAKTFYDDINTKKFTAMKYFEQICLDKESYK